MKHIKKYLCLALLLGSAGLIASDFDNFECEDTVPTCVETTCNNGPTTVLPLIMQLGSNLHTQYHKPFYSMKDEDDCNKWMCDLSATYRYAHTYGGCETIAPLLFGSSTLHFMGTDVNPNDGTALIADYFGLAKDTDVSLKINPKIKNNILDFQFATGGDHIWFQINLPVMHSKWELANCSTQTGFVSGANLQNKNERVLLATGPATTPQMIAEAPTSGSPVTTTQDFNVFLKDATGSKGFATKPAAAAYSEIGEIAYMESASLAVTNAEDAAAIDIKTAYTDLVAGNELSTDETASATSLKQALSGFTFGDLDSRKYNKFAFGKKNCGVGKWKIADLQLMLGYDFCKTACYHFGVYAKAVVPTGTAINEKYAEYIFQPLIGNGRHFELGGGLSGHWEIWNCDDSSLDLNVDGYVTHMFKKSSFRSFDLLNKPMTRYALMKVLNTGSEEDEDTWGYNGDLVVAGDVNAQCVNVKSTVRGEAMVDLIYSACNWEIGLGYAFSGKSKEDFDCSLSSLISSNKRYALKGQTGLNVLKLVDSDGYSTVGAAAPTLSIKTNNFIDNGDMYSFNNDDVLDANDEDNKELLYSLPSANRSGLMDGQILNKIFAHVDYTWSDNCWMPTLGLIGSISFTPDSSNRTAKFWDLGARVGCSF